MISNAIVAAVSSSCRSGPLISNNGIANNLTGNNMAPSALTNSGDNAPTLQPSYAMLVASNVSEQQVTELTAANITATNLDATATNTTEIVTPELAAQLPLNDNTLAGALTTNHLASTVSTVTATAIKQTDNQVLLAAINTRTPSNRIQAPVLLLPPLAQSPYTQADTHLSTGMSTGMSTTLNLAPTAPSQVSSQTTSLPIATHLPTTSLQGNAAGEHTSVGLPLGLSEPRAMESLEVSNPLLAATTRPANQVSQWGPVPITPTAPQTQQAQELLSPLREQLRFQIDQQIKQAELRLDPPELGKVELSIRLDGDRLHIQIHAANASVRDSLQIGLDRLRSELAMDHGGQIDVDVGQGEKEQQTPNNHGGILVAQQNTLGASPSHQTHQQASNSVDLLA